MAFNTLSALQTIHAKNANVLKGDEFYGLLDGGTEGGKSVQMTANNHDHAARRKIFNQALPRREQAFRSLDELAGKFVESLHRTAQEAQSQQTTEEKKGWVGPADVTLIATWFSFDVISTIAFGQSLDMLHSSEYRWVPTCLRDASIFLYWAGYAPFLWCWQWLLGSNLPSMLGMGTVMETQKYGAFAEETFNRRAKRLETEVELDAERADIFQHLVGVNMYSKYDLRADSSLLIAAGSDANRLIIAGTVFYWLKNPETHGRVTEEIRSCVSSAADISDSALSSLKYLRACVDETMRLLPPKASSLPREVMKGGIMIDDIFIPEGATVGSSTYALHHHPDIFPDPFSYNPERWLQQSPNRRMQASFNPFLKGPRMCPGQTVAYFAIELALFHLVFRYDVRAADGLLTGGGHSGGPKGRRREDEYQFDDWILGFAKGPLVDLKERDLQAE